MERCRYSGVHLLVFRPYPQWLVVPHPALYCRCHDVFFPTATAVTAIEQDELPLDESSATAMGSGSGSSIVERTV